MNSFSRDTTISAKSYERKTESPKVGTITKASLSKIISLLKDTTIPVTSYEHKDESAKVGTASKVASPKMSSLLRDTIIPATSYEQETESSKVGTSTKATSLKMISLLRNATIPASSYEQKAESSKVGTTTKAASSKMMPLYRDTIMPAISYEPKIESSKMTIMWYEFVPFTSNGEKRLDEMACSHINVSSNLAMHEQYPKLFGVYERVQSVKGRAMYRNPKTRSEVFYSNNIYHSNYYDNHTETEEYRSKWALLFQDYLAFDINCNDLMSTNCYPEWRFCNASALEGLELKLDCIIIETIKFQCNTDSMDIKPTEDNQEKCQELELSSNDGIAKTIPEIMGIYSLEDYLYNDMAVYDKDMRFHLYYRNTSSAFKLPYVGTLNQKWTIDNGTHMHSDNILCEDTDLSMDGNCEFGWSYPSNWSGLIAMDLSASIVCIKPSPVVTDIPTGAICQTFQLMSTTAFEFGVPVEVFLLGEYVITESTYNGKVVYRNSFASKFLYFIVTKSEKFDKYWAIGHELGSESDVNLFNLYCSILENPVNGNCKYGWFYYNPKSKAWKYDMNMRIQCTYYGQNSIT